MISVVVPVYNEEHTISELHERLVKTLAACCDSYEIVFVNDGSTDNTEKTALTLKPLELISFAKNQGQTPALNAGIRKAKGDIIVFLDADLQNNPEDIPKLLEKISQGCGAVVGRREHRQDPAARTIFSKVANFIARLLLGVKVHDFGCGLKAYRAEFIKNFELWGQVQVFLPAIAKARGAKVCEVGVAHNDRKAGVSKIKISNMVKGGLGLLKIAFIARFLNPYR
ncbi:MAG: glycosyltransferase family 2 protein [Candidatus Giovannonibacteria bacterium]|nr:MAG: glycosyltransferase family 2 protein [Candidatus Giovannonibacteria bacterium]